MLTVVIPAFNEAPNIAPLLAEIAVVQADFPALTEVIIVDDGSSDGTLDVLKTNKTLYPWLAVIHLPQRSGKSSAQWYGIRDAKNELIVTMDGDRQNDPTDIPTLLVAYQKAITDHQQPVFVIGQRKYRHDNWLRRVSSQIANNVRQYFLRDNILDSGCAVRLFRRDDYMMLPFFSNMHRFIPALALQNGASLIPVSISHRPRVAGVAKFGLWNRLGPGIVDLFGMLWLGCRRRAVSRTVRY